MKKRFKVSVFFSLTFWLAACGGKTDLPAAQPAGQNNSAENPTEVSRVLTSEKGDTIYLTYFAKEDEIAVRLKRNGEERELEAKGNSEKGNPVFSDGDYGWEMFVDGRSGRLFQQNGEEMIYREN